MWLPRNPRFPKGAWKRPWLSSSYTEQKSLANSLNQSCRNGNQQLPESHCSLSAPNMPRWVLFADIWNRWSLHLKHPSPKSSHDWLSLSIQLRFHLHRAAFSNRSPTHYPGFLFWQHGFTWMSVRLLSAPHTHTLSAKSSEDRGLVYLVHCYNSNVWNHAWHKVVHSKI